MEIMRKVLPTGLNIILAPVPGTNTITAILGARAGWKYETSKNNGIAHFLEHMAFKGTKKRPTTLDITKAIEGRGGEMNAFTGEEITGYHVRLPYKFVEVGCDIVSDMLLNSKLEQEEINRESGTIIEELRMYHDVPMQYIGGIVWPKLLYGNQPAGQNGLGTEEGIKSMRRAQFIDFMEKLYVSENTVFCLAGRLPNLEKTKKMVEKYFRNIKKGGPKLAKPTVIENQKKPEMLFVEKEIEQSHLLLGVRAYNIHHPKKHAFKVLRTVLGGNMSSRMFTEVRERRGLAYYIRCPMDMQTDVGSFGTWTGVNRDKVIEATEVIMNEYRKIREKKVPAEELRRAKDYIIGSRQMSLESSAAIAFDLMEQFIIEEKITPQKETEEKINAVTAEEVRDVANEIFVDEGLNMALVSPPQNQEKIMELLKF